MMPRATVSFYWESFRLLPSRRNTPVNTRRAFASHRAVHPFFDFTRVPLFPGAGVCFTLAATMIERCGAGMNDQKTRQLITQALDTGAGIVRLMPTWVPRLFCVPGRRLRLQPPIDIDLCIRLFRLPYRVKEKARGHQSAPSCLS